MTDKVDLLLQQFAAQSSGKQSEIEVKKRNPISQAYITSFALEKARKYAELACMVLRQSVECYGYLIAPQDTKDRIVRDVFLAHDQKVTGGHVDVSAEGIIKAGRAIDKMGWRVLGWWHSHGSLSTFHSDEDEENMFKILNAIAPSNIVQTHREIPVFSGKIKARRRGDLVQIFDESNPDHKLEFNLKGGTFDPKLLRGMKDLKFSVPLDLGFAYSVVVNAKRDKPYCEIATKEFCGFCHEGEELTRKSNLVVVQEEGVMDERKMIRQISKRVKPLYRRWAGPQKGHKKGKKHQRFWHRSCHEPVGAVHESPEVVDACEPEFVEQHFVEDELVDDQHEEEHELVEGQDEEEHELVDGRHQEEHEAEVVNDLSYSWRRDLHYE